MQSVTFIAVNYNNFVFTQKMCESLERQSGAEVEFKVSLVIVNNSNAEADSNALHDYSEGRDWITVVDYPDNPGYFGGLNRGLAALSEVQKSWVIIGNNDLEFKDDFTISLLKKIYPANTMAIAPDVITPDGVHQNPSIPDRISHFQRLHLDIYFYHYYAACILGQIWKLFPKRRPSESELVEREIHMGIGACYVLTPEFSSKCSQLHCPTFLYGEEWFFSEQIHKNGGLLWFDPSLKVFHAGSAALSKFPKRVTYEFARKGYSQYGPLV